jgi:hypothetical protein
VTWQTVPGASSYILQYSLDPNFVSGVMNIAGVSSPTTINGLSSDTLYYVQVEAVGTISTWSGRYSVITSPTFALVDSLTDTNGALFPNHIPEMGSSGTDFDGVWWIQSNQATLESSGSGSESCGYNVGLSDVSFAVTQTEGGSAGFDGGLIVRGDGTNNNLILVDGISDSIPTITLSVKSSGTLTTLTSTYWDNANGVFTTGTGPTITVAQSQSYRLRTLTIGTSISLLANGCVVAKASSGRYQTNTRVGFHANSSASLASYGPCRAYAYNVADPQVIVWGNSLPAGFGLTYGMQAFPYQLTADLGEPWIGYNLGVNGQTIEQMQSRYVGTVDVLYNSRRRKNVMILVEGTNSIGPGNESAATTYANLTALIQTCQATGYYVIVATVANGTFATHPGWFGRRNALNTLIIANTAGANAVWLDPAYDARYQDTTNTTYFQADGLHWTSALANIAASELQLLVQMA